MNGEGLNELLIHPKTKLVTELFLKRPGQVLLITGEAGSGKYGLALALSSSLLGIDSEKLRLSERFKVLGVPDGKTEIAIETIRTLISELKLKMPTRGTVARVVIIRQAESMSLEAQNSLLKLL